MKRRGAAPASLASDPPSVPASPAQRWQALFGSQPPARSDALVAAAVTWAEQVAAAGDVASAIQHDLAIVAHQVRVARLDRQAGVNGATCAVPGELGPAFAGPGGNGAPCTKSPQSAAPCAMWPDAKQGMVHHLARDGDGDGDETTEAPPPPLLPKPRTRRAPARVAAPLPTASSQLSIGARLVKVHGGMTHVVDVTADGMRYQGQLFGSLSAVARHITGTHWNGLLFFGLRRRKTYPQGARSHGQA